LSQLSAIVTWGGEERATDAGRTAAAVTSVDFGPDN
jgi:hypothetical protein